MTQRSLISIILLIAVGALVLVRGASMGAAGVAFGFEPGERVADVTYEAIDGRAGRLSDFRDAAALVVAVRDVGCPVAGRYGPGLGRLEAEYAARGVAFLYLNVNAEDSTDDIRAAIERFGFDGPYIADADAPLARALRPRSTTEAFVIDRAGTLRYRGAIDDQYGIDFTKPAPRETWLRDALDAVLAGDEVEVPKTHPEGCLLARPADDDVAFVRPLTYHNRISRIVQRNCLLCHREGGVAPFSLASYERVYNYRAMIRFMTETRRMPPWFAHEGEWANDRSLSDRDLRDLLAWIDAGAPEGDPEDAPLPRRFADGWQIGEPDAVVRLPEPFTIPADGVVDYQYMYVKTDFGEDKWVRGVEIRPTARQVTHHVLVFVEPPGAKSAREADPGEPVWQGGIDGYFAATAPGFPGVVYPEGMAKRLPAGAWLKFQLHYTPNGVEAVDRTEIGFIFDDGPPEHEVETASAFNTRFVIPPGAKDYRVDAEYTFREPGRLLTLFPHTHVRGKAFRYTLELPDGTEEVLLDLPRYDFNWQLSYHFAKPREVPAGATLHATAWYDNSADNPANPDPTVEVRFGEQTFDEMMIGYFDWVRWPWNGAAVHRRGR